MYKLGNIDIECNISSKKEGMPFSKDLLNKFAHMINPITL